MVTAGKGNTMLQNASSLRTKTKSRRKILFDTVNAHGFIHALSSVSMDFVLFGDKAPGCMLDVGSGTGVATVPALSTGAEVIALDMEATHLEVLRASTPAEYLPNLRTIAGRYPEALDEIDRPIGAVLISQVLGFLTGEEIRTGFARLYELMAPGGKLFVINYTPYITLTANFVPLYEERCRRGAAWPGVVGDLRDYCDDAKLLYNLPKSLNLMDPTVLTREALVAGFDVEYSSFLGGGQVPERFQLDGREWACVVAVKP